MKYFFYFFDIGTTKKSYSSLTKKRENNRFWNSKIFFLISDTHKKKLKNDISQIS